MSAEAWPPSLRPIGKYLVRAKEIEQQQPLISYYCNLYALEKAIAIRDKNDPQTSKFIAGLLDKCETQKSTLPPGTPEEHKLIFEEFALGVFKHADDEDRAGQATQETAKNFFVAVCFFEVLDHFGPLEIDIEEKVKYAKWKAIDIRKAIAEGRKPIPGPPGGLQQEAQQDNVAGTPAAFPQITPPPAAGSPVVQLSMNPAYSSLTTSMQQPHQSVAPSAPPSVTRGQETNLPYSTAAPSHSAGYPSIAPSYNLGYAGAASPSEIPGFSQGTMPQAPLYSQASPTYSAAAFPAFPTASPPPSLSTPSAPIRDNVPLSQQATRPAEPQIATTSKAPVANVDLSAAGQYVYDPSFRPSVSACSGAQKAAKNAASALDFQDIKTAVSELQKALSLLTGK